MKQIFHFEIYPNMYIVINVKSQRNCLPSTSNVIYSFDAITSHIHKQNLHKTQHAKNFLEHSSFKFFHIKSNHKKRNCFFVDFKYNINRQPKFVHH